MYLDSITSPTLLIDEEKCRNNIGRMAQKADTHGLQLKPHFKTHQSADIGQWFKDESVTGITVSSLKMADYFARHGWDDITVAFPVNIREISEINRLSGEIDLKLLISDQKSVRPLQKQLEREVKVFIEIDTGSGRTGFSMENLEEIDEVIETIRNSEKLSWIGFYSHPGHSYASRSQKEIRAIHDNVVKQCISLRSRYKSLFNNLMICIGDTPCCSIGDDFTAIDQISPGNFVFYDVMQTYIGSCSYNDIAIALACPVVAKYPSRNELIIHGGAIHLSKEQVSDGSTTHFGLPVFLDESGWQMMGGNNYVKAISQEHGIVRCTSENINSINIGELLGILPVHSCLTADLMMEYHNLEGKRLNHIRKLST